MESISISLQVGSVSAVVYIFNHFYCAKVGLYFGTSSPRNRMVKGHRSHQDDDDACDHAHVKYCEMPRPLPLITTSLACNILQLK